MSLSNRVTDGHTVRDLGWRQGSFLPPAEVRRLAEAHQALEATHAVILSQDCDLTHKELEVEPFAEILFLKQLERPNPGLVDGKSSRRLHVEADQGGESLFLLAQPWHRIQIPRKELAATAPDGTISLKSDKLRILIEWVAERYTRTAFPDAFVNRINAVDEKLKKLVKNHSSLFWRLLIRIEPSSELQESENYELMVTCVVHHRVWEDFEGQKNAKDVAGKLEAELKKCPGIELISFDVDTDAELPLSILADYRTWDIFNYLTHRERLNGVQ